MILCSCTGFKRSSRSALVMARHNDFTGSCDFKSQPVSSLRRLTDVACKVGPRQLLAGKPPRGSLVCCPVAHEIVPNVETDLLVSESSRHLSYVASSCDVRCAGVQVEVTSPASAVGCGFLERTFWERDSSAASMSSSKTQASPERHPERWSRRFSMGPSNPGDDGNRVCDASEVQAFPGTTLAPPRARQKPVSHRASTSTFSSVRSSASPLTTEATHIQALVCCAPSISPARHTEKTDRFTIAFVLCLCTCVKQPSRSALVMARHSCSTGIWTFSQPLQRASLPAAPASQCSTGRCQPTSSLAKPHECRVESRTAAVLAAWDPPRATPRKAGRRCVCLVVQLQDRGLGLGKLPSPLRVAQRQGSFVGLPLHAGGGVPRVPAGFCGSTFGFAVACSRRPHQPLRYKQQAPETNPKPTNALDQVACSTLLLLKLAAADQTTGCREVPAVSSQLRAVQATAMKKR